MTVVSSQTAADATEDESVTPGFKPRRRRMIVFLTVMGRTLGEDDWRSGGAQRLNPRRDHRMQRRKRRL